MGVTDDSVGLEIEREVAEGSDGAEICIEEVNPDVTGEMELDPTEIGGEIRCPNPPLREESVEAGLFELGSGTSSGLTSSEIVGTSDGGDMTLSISTGSGSGSIIIGSGSSTSLDSSIDFSTSGSSISLDSSIDSSTATSSISLDGSIDPSITTSSVTLDGSIDPSITTSSPSISLDGSMDSSTSSSSSSSSTMVLAFCPQRHSAVPKSVEASLRQTSQVSKSVLASVVHSSAVLKVECTSEGDLAVLNSVGVPSAEWKLSSDGMFGRETNDAVDGVFSPSDGS